MVHEMDCGEFERRPVRKLTASEGWGEGISRVHRLPISSSEPREAAHRPHRTSTITLCRVEVPNATNEMCAHCARSRGRDREYL